MMRSSKLSPEVCFVNPSAMQDKQLHKTPLIKKLVILDWDDTLIPTTAIFKKKESASFEQLNEIGECIYNFLYSFISIFGAESIYIVTNGGKNWVFHSLQILQKMQNKATTANCRHFELIQQLLMFYLNGRVASAQQLFGAEYPGKTALWKTLTFRLIASQHFGGIAASKENRKQIQLVSIGDSADEMMASAETKKMMEEHFGPNTCVLHQVRLLYKPRISELIGQMELVRNIADGLSREEAEDVNIDLNQIK